MVTSKRASKKNLMFSGPTQLKVGEYLDFFLPGFSKLGKVPNWPPDAFALAASLLQKAGGYMYCGELVESETWAKELEILGSEWRTSGKVPAKVTEWWYEIFKEEDHPLSQLRASTWRSLIGIAGSADEASEGFGVPQQESPDKMGQEALDQLQRDLGTVRSSSLCKEISPSRVCVLPKLHTPRTGTTIRSMSHHLALCKVGEVLTQWVTLPWASNPTASERHSLNLLLLPWPTVITPSHFQEVKKFNRREEPGWGYFKYVTRGGSPLDLVKIRGLLTKAMERVGRIDGVIMPELALREGEPKRVFESIRKINPSAFLIAGANLSQEKGRFKNANSWTLTSPILEKEITDLRHESAMYHIQGKHHRWRLDRSQVSQYGLGAPLDPRYDWWEATGIQSRKVWFFSLYSWLTFCPLICEDLARQDPISDIVRAVGPNLVIALLMDGPQLKERWPARYATVLADDPGSSVLTLTSLGMAELCRPHGKSVSRKVALWKDAGSGETVEIELPTDHEAIVICLTGEFLEEWTADGRSDEKTSGYLHLTGIHPIKLS